MTSEPVDPVPPGGRIVPFLKWAGGKRWLANRSTQILPETYQRYLEPFLGSGAVFFRYAPKHAILSDVNGDLICTYQAIQDDWQRVQRYLDLHSRQHSDEYYYIVRDQRPRCQFRKAARFIYLNRTCWNGLYRVNQKGHFNVPRGTKDSVILDTDNFAAISELLASVLIQECDFEQTIDLARRGDVLFVDPPYTVKHNLNGFVRYNEKIFSWEDQERLAAAIVRAANRGAYVTITNANHTSIKELYTDATSMLEINRSSVISGQNHGRGGTSELLIKYGW